MIDRVVRLGLRAGGYVARPLIPTLTRYLAAPRVEEVTWSRRSSISPVGPLRIALVTDIHAGPTTPLGYVEKAVSTVGDLAPDAILYGGDFLFRDAAYAEPLGDLLGKLAAPFGCYAVIGNHDRWLDADRIVHALTSAGVRVLLNSGVRLATTTGSLWLGGVDDLWTGTPDVAAALQGRHAGEATVLLSHNPDIAVEAAACSTDLVLAGHTHGGQIRLFGRALFSNSRFGNRFAAGWARLDETDVYTSRGLGTVEIPLRIGSSPELTILTVQ